MTLFTNGGSRDRYVDEKISPIPGIHNGIWAQTPGIETVNDPSQWDWVKKYEQDVLDHFKDDKRIIAWCLYNEPENVPACHTYPLLKKVFEWAREVNPSQPLTAPIYTRPLSGSGNLTTRFPTVTFLCENCDVLSIHCYQPAEEMQKFVDLMKTFNRPIFCTEYLARPFGSTFETVLPVLKRIRSRHTISDWSGARCNVIMNGTRWTRTATRFHIRKSRTLGSMIFSNPTARLTDRLRWNL